MQTTYREGHAEPGVCGRVKREDLSIAVLALQSTVHDHFLRGHDRCSMVRDAARAPARRLNLLPLEVDLVVLLLHRLVDPGEV